eukprot:2015333-Rhodomonas_salina.1
MLDLPAVSGAGQLWHVSRFGGDLRDLSACCVEALQCVWAREEVLLLRQNVEDRCFQLLLPARSKAADIRAGHRTAEVEAEHTWRRQKTPA